jgi:hypothetical protein
MEFGLEKALQLSGIQNNTSTYFSSQDSFCESKESFSKKKKKKIQSKFNSISELELLLFSNEDDKYNELTKKATHKVADQVSNIATNIAGNAIAKVSVKKKSGLFPGYRTRKARREYANNFKRKYGSSVNSLTHVGADYLHDKYLKD